jgi:hypothetical protein
MATLADTMLTKLTAHYPTKGNVALDDFTYQFQLDNPTFTCPLGNPTFYTQLSTESLCDAALRWWSAYVP